MVLAVVLESGESARTLTFSVRRIRNWDVNTAHTVIDGPAGSGKTFVALHMYSFHGVTVARKRC